MINTERPGYLIDALGNSHSTDQNSKNEQRYPYSHAGY